MKRILLLNYEFPPVGGGGGVASHVIAKGYVAAGYEVDVVTTWMPGLPKRETVDGITVYRVFVPGRMKKATGNLISLLLYPVAAFLRGVLLCWNHEYAFIHTFFVVPTGPLGYALSRLFSIPDILSAQGGDIYDPTKKLSPHRQWYLRAAVRFLLNRAHAITTESEDLVHNTSLRYATTRVPHLIAHPYEPHEYPAASRRELGLKEGVFYTASVGRLVKRKGFDWLIRAIAADTTGKEALIMGDGPEREALRTLAEELGVALRVHLLGFVPAEKKHQYLAASDAFVLTSLHEGLGLVLLEAMHAGLPVVATDVGGQTDVVADGENGRLVRFGDTGALLAALDEMTPEFSARAKKKSREILARHEVGKIIREYLALV